MNPNLFPMLLIILAGGATALQAPTNARLMTAVSDASGTETETDGNGAFVKSLSEKSLRI